MIQYSTVLRSFGVPLALVLLTACTPLVEGAKKSANSLKQAGDDTSRTWRRLFTYDPPPTDPQPADTRYCYKRLTDIVCYDAPQPQTTSKIIGVQGPEGARLVNYSQAAQPISDTYSAPIPEVEVVPESKVVTSGSIGEPENIAPPLTPKANAPFHSGPSPHAK